MEIKKTLEADLKNAMRINDDTSKRTIRMALSNIKFAEIERRTPLDEGQIIDLLHKEIKTRWETIEEAKKISRQDLINVNLAEIEIIKRYLPEEMSEEEIMKFVREAIQEVDANSPADMGKVMKVVLPKLKGKASNEKISNVVRRLLNS
jgi:uncharacterized protein